MLPFSSHGSGGLHRGIATQHAIPHAVDIMTDAFPPKTSLILYHTEDGCTRIQCRFEDETLWLTQVQLSEIFKTSVPNMNLRLKAIYV